jgi:multidrug efflux pump subunit AcrA (membrane-fusion protein)
LAALSLVLLATGCAGASRPRPTSTPWPTPVVSEKPTYVVQRGAVIDQFIVPGQVAPTVWDALFFPVDGKLSSLKVSEGVEVQQGDILAELDMKLLSDQLAQAQVGLEQAQDRYDQQQTSRGNALSRARDALRLQEITLERLQRTAQQTIPAQQELAAKELDRARYNLQKAQAEYDKVAWRSDIAALPQAAALQQATLDFAVAEARFKLQAIGDIDLQIAAQEIQVKQARAAVQDLEQATDPALERDLTKAKLQVQSLERQMEERRLRAPYAGRVIAVGLGVQGIQNVLAVRPKIGDNIAAFAPLIALAKPGQLEITIPADRERVSELAVGQVLTASHGLARDRPFSVRVIALPVHTLSGGARPASPQVVRVEISADAPPMSIGDYVDITVVNKASTAALFVHPAALRRFLGRTFVVVQDGDKQRRVDVTTGLENRERVEILSGLNEGDVVVGP